MNCICRFENCGATFDHRKKRLTHERAHRKKGDKPITKTYKCKCCRVPAVFDNAKSKQNHEYYNKRKGRFVCACGTSFPTKQKMQRHRCEGERLDKYLKQKKEKRGKVEMSEYCEICNKKITDKGNDWWCYNCGLGYCNSCYRGRSINHVYEC